MGKQLDAARDLTLYDLVVSADWLVTLNPEHPLIEGGAVAIQGARIAWVGDRRAAASLETIDRIDRPGCVLLPGFVNGHTHLFQSLFRGLGDDRDLFSWIRDVVWPFVELMKPDDLYLGTLVGALGAVRTGTTTVLENHYSLTDLESCLLVRDALAEVGIRGMVARGVVGGRTAAADQVALPDTLFRHSAAQDMEIMEECLRENAGSDLVRFSPSPLMLSFIEPELAAEAISLGRRYSVGWHTHCSEVRQDPELFRRLYDRDPVVWLHENDLLGPDATLAHGIWLSDEEIDLLGKSGASVVHNPVSNGFVAAGVLRIEPLLTAGVNIALGTDGPGSNIGQDMLEVMKTCLLLQKAVTEDPRAASAEEVTIWATKGGARSLGLHEELGLVIPSFKADLIAVELANVHAAPVHRVASSLVYGANGRDVRLTVVDGRVVFDGERVVGVDEDSILQEARARAEMLVAKAGLSMPNGSWRSVERIRGVQRA